MVKFNKCSSMLASALIAGSLAGCAKADNTRQTATISEASKVVITDEAQLNAVADIRQTINHMYDVGANLKLIMSNDESADWYMMYNKNKDCYAEMGTGGALTYQSNGDRTVFTSSVTQGKDLDPLAIMTNMIILAEEGVATIDVSVVDSVTGLEINNEAGSMKEEVESIASETVTEETETVTEETETVTDETETVAEENETVAEENETVAEENETAIEESLEETQEAGVEINQYVITVKGIDDIRKIYSMTLTESEADAVLSSIFMDNLTNKESDKTNYLYKLTVNTKENNAISARVTLTMDGIEYIGWWFDGYLEIGDWSLPEGWGGSHTEEEWIELYEQLKTNLQQAIDTYAKNNLTEEQIKMMQTEVIIEETSPDLAETSEADENIEAAEPDDYVASIIRDESFNDMVQALLEKDGISEEDIESFEVPEGYSTEDKAKMVELYNTIKEWDKDQVTGVLVSPISMTDIYFITDYILACKEEYSKDVKSSENDKYGAIFWEDTLGTFIKMIE